MDARNFSFLLLFGLLLKKRFVFSAIVSWPYFSSFFLDFFFSFNISFGTRNPFSFEFFGAGLAGPILFGFPGVVTPIDF